MQNSKLEGCFKIYRCEQGELSACPRLPVCVKRKSCDLKITNSKLTRQFTCSGNPNHSPAIIFEVLMRLGGDKSLFVEIAEIPLDNYHFYDRETFFLTRRIQLLEILVFPFCAKTFDRLTVIIQD